MIKALKYLPKSSLTNLLDDLEPETYLIILANAIVPISIIIAIVHYPLCVGRMDLILV